MKKIAFSIAAVLIISLAMSHAEQPVATPSQAQLHVYLLMGQSNMAGRGTVEASDQETNPRILVLNKDGQWELAKDPLHWDKPKMVGVGPGMSFARAMIQADKNITIGLVPCAVGGTSLSQWYKGEKLYENAVARAKVAAQTGTLKGVLWHQGEGGIAKGIGPELYAEKFAGMFKDFRQDVGVTGLPVVLGTLGDFLNRAQATTVNTQIESLPKLLDHVAVAEATGLQHRGDNLHFSAAAQREFGPRYAAAMQKLQR